MFLNSKYLNNHISLSVLVKKKYPSICQHRYSIVYVWYTHILLIPIDIYTILNI